MIYTCTTNPSLDYYINLTEDIKVNDSNRSDFESYEAGGKGVNVSCVLNNLNIPSVCLGFLGGFTQDFYLEHLKAYKQIQPLFTIIKSNTRINIKLTSSYDITDINANGPAISEDEFKKFEKRLLSIYPNDYFVLCGHIQSELEDEVVRVVHDLAKDGVKIVLDCNLEVMKKCADANPFLIRINDPDFKNEELDETARSLIEMGAKNVLYSSFSKPYCLYSDNEKYVFKDVDANRKYITGTSETLIAGYLYGMLRGANPYESFKYACATIKSTTVAPDPLDNGILEKKFEEVEIAKESF